jgi:Flp pilus assembly pilin Flp
MRPFLKRGMVARAATDEHVNMTRKTLLRFARREDGQTMAEYSVILGVITPAIIAVLVVYHNTLVDTFQRVVDVMS